MSSKNYNLFMSHDDIDRVILKLSKYTNIEIREIVRRSGMIQIKTNTIEKLTEISEILNIEIDTKFYINRIAIL